MKIELSKEQIDAVTKAKIEALEKQVRSLENKLKNRDKTIQNLRDGADFTKERREKVKELAKLIEDKLGVSKDVKSEVKEETKKSVKK